jgi:hypothetical protein
MIFNDIQALADFAQKAKLPSWQAKLFEKYRDQVQVHSKGELFYKIDRLFPNEHPMSKCHRVMAFEPVTKASFLKGISNIMRIFSNSSYEAEASEKTIEYITKHYFDNKNLFSYFLELWITKALGDDPNSLIIVYPKEYNDSKPYEQVLAIPSEHIVHYDEDSVIFKSEEESEVEYTVEQHHVHNEIFFDYDLGRNNIRQAEENTYSNKLKVKFIRTTFHAFVQDKFYTIVQRKDDSDKYDVTEYDVGTNTYPCAVFAGGMKAERQIFESFLSPFVPFGNLALLQHSQHTAVNSIFSFPRMSEVQSPCDAQCNNGEIICDVSEAHPDGRMECPTCHGTGYRAVQSPYKVYIKKFDPSGLNANDNLNVDDVRYYSPPASTLEYSKNEWKDYLDMAEQAIYVQQKMETGNIPSAKSKEVDLEELYSFLLRVSKVFYDRLRFIIQCFENYLNNAPIEITVHIPFSFAILNENEAFDALNNILTSTAPEIIKSNQVDNFITKFVSVSSPVKKAYQVLRLVDLLLLKTDNEIGNLKANNIVSADQWVTHTFAYPVLMQLYEADKQLFLEDNQFIADKLKLALETYKPQASELKSVLLNKFAPPIAV